MSTLDNLLALVQDAIGEAPKGKGFEKEMSAILARAHTAASLAAAAERAGVRVDTGLFKGLSKAERADIRKAVGEQLKYLEKFVADMGDMSEAQVAARAGMYAGSVRSTFYGARYPGLSQYPGDGNTQCLTRCLCELEEKDDGIHWILGGEGCSDCQAMAAGSPYGRE